MLPFKFKREAGIAAGTVVFAVFAYLVAMAPADLLAQTNNINTPVCAPAKITFVARNARSEFIPNINFTIFKQDFDVDNNPKRGGSIVTGRTDPILGRGIVNVPGTTAGPFAIEVWDRNQAVGEFWFYNQLAGLGCGYEETVTVSLSGIHATIVDGQQTYLKNVRFSLFTQKQDVENKPIKDTLIAQYSTLVTGDVTTYVADQSHTMSGNTPRSYVLEVTGPQGGTYTKYGISVSNAATTDVQFILSDFLFTVIDADRVPYPANTKVEVYQQASDIDGTKILGQKVRDVLTNDRGLAVFQNPAGTYAARVQGSDGLYTTYWDLAMRDQQRTPITIQTNSGFTTTPGACSEPSKLTIIARSNDEFVPGISFELYQQAADVNGQPIAGARVVAGKVGDDGQSTVVFNPDPTKIYVLKMYHKNQKVGDYWFFDKIKFTCGESKTISKGLSAIKVILRDGAGDLLTNVPFSIYTQKTDIDGNPRTQQSDVVAEFNTGTEGYAVAYVAPDHPYNKLKRGVYALSVRRGSAEYVSYGITVSAGTLLTYEYTLGDAVLDVQDATGNSLANKQLQVFRQTTDVKGKPARSAQAITSIKTDTDGTAVLAAPAGTYVVSLKDDGQQDVLFWNMKLENSKRINKTLVAPSVEVTARDESDVAVAEKTPIAVYGLVRDYETGNYYRRNKVAQASVGQNGYATLVLAPGPYVFSVQINKQEYVQPGYVRDKGDLRISIVAGADSLADNNKKFKVGGNLQPQSLNQASSLQEKMKGRILLQVESHGEAWYVDKKNGSRFYLKDGPAAYALMRKLGVGITNTDLSKIPVGLDDRITDVDTDGDGLSDKLEQAIGTNTTKADTDGDGANDGAEVRSGTNPVGTGAPSFDTAAANKGLGTIYLQVQSHGEAWYVNPTNGKRYYLADGPTAYKLMRFLSLGIKNTDLQKIKEGKLE